MLLGAEIAVESMDFGDFLVALDDRPPNVFTVNWIADYASPHALYGLLLDSGAASNWGARRDAEFVELLERSEEHTSELPSLLRIAYPVFCLQKKKAHNDQY